jgi:hypothetical protein
VPVPLADLVSRVPKEVEERVDRARQRWNGPIREILRQETGLRPYRPDVGETAGAQQSLKDAIGIPIRLEPGLPKKLERLQLDDAMALRVVLGRKRISLEMLRAGAADVQQLVAELARMGQARRLLEGREAQLAVAEEIAKRLLAELTREEPMRKILEVDEDVLGVYAYRLPEQMPLVGPDLPIDVRIELYWTIIGLAAELLGRSVESVTFVVLAHELAHAYTHLACDTDGHRWGAHAFARSDHTLKEGLAQYYTQTVCFRLDEQLPEGRQAYEALLKTQPPAYQTHWGWIKKGFAREEIRRAMVETRRAGVGRVTEFNDRLMALAARVKGHAG